MKITRKGIETPLKGVQPVVGAIAPAFALTDLNDEVKTLNDYQGKKLLLSVYPDIDTRVCDLQTKFFFKAASDYPNLKILSISNNTKQQLEDWCVTNGIEMDLLRDTDRVFAENYGLWMPEFSVLARSIFVIDADGKIIYEEIVPEMSQEPNYQAALEAAK